MRRPRSALRHRAAALAVGTTAGLALIAFALYRPGSTGLEHGPDGKAANGLTPAEQSDDREPAPVDPSDKAIVQGVIVACQATVESRARDLPEEHRVLLLQEIRDARHFSLRVGLALRACFELETANCLIALGHATQARTSLAAHAATKQPDPGTAADTYVADGLSLLAELELTAGDYSACDHALERALLYAQRASADGRVSADRSLAYCYGVRAKSRTRLGLLPAAAQDVQALESIAARLADDDLRRRAAFCSVEFEVASARPEAALARLAQIAEADLDASLRLVRGIARWHHAREMGSDESAPLRRLAHADLIAALDDSNLPPSLWGRGQLALAANANDEGKSEAALGYLATLRSRSEAYSNVAAQAEGLRSRLVRLGATSASDKRKQLAEHERAYATLLGEWRTSPVRRGGTSFLAFGERRETLAELLLLIAACDDDPTRAAEDALSRVLQAQAHSSLTRELAGDAFPRVGLADVRHRLLHDGDGVVLFVAAHQSSVMIGCDRNTAWLAELPGTPDLIGDALPLQGELEDLDDAQPAARLDRVRTLSGQLAGKILPEAIRDRIGGWRQMIVADHGFLQGLPWEVLAWSPDQLLGERYAITTLSSLPLGLRLAARHRTMTPEHARLHLFATLMADRALVANAADRRQLAESELDVITRHYPRSAGGLRLTNEALTWPALAGSAGDACVAQFLVHGHDLPETELSNVLLLASTDSDRGLLDAARIAGMTWPGVVLLSACGTARGRWRLGDESFQTTLAASFLRAGAHTVVHSRTDLRLSAHLRLLGTVHARLVQGDSPATALRVARQAQATADAPWAERLVHAQVQVVGLGHLPIIAR